MQPSVFEGVDLVYHLAAEIEDPEKMKALQIRGTQNLLEAAQTAGVRRWIQLSSVGVYGPPGAQVIHEQTEPAPIGLYEKTKFKADCLVETTCRGFGMEYVILRPSNVLGSGMKNQSFFSLVQAVRQRRFFYIGPPGAIATFVHADDVARALIACQQAPSGSIYNLSSDCSWEAIIGQIASYLCVPAPTTRLPKLPLQLILQALDGRVKIPLTISRLNSLTRRAGYSIERIVNELNFSFAKPMPEGIRDLLP